MNAVTSSLVAPSLREACGQLVRQLRSLGYPHADSTTCKRMLTAYFPYDPDLAEGSPDAQAAEAFLLRLLDQCRRREIEKAAPLRRRRCYGEAVEQAVTEVDARGDLSSVAPRLTELMTQLDADGHNTTHLRIELEALIDACGMKQFYR